MAGGALTFLSGPFLRIVAFLPGEGLLSLVSPNFMSLLSPIFSGGLWNIAELGEGACKDSFLPLAGLDGTGGGGMVGGGPGVAPYIIGRIGPGGPLELGIGGLEGGRPLVAMAGG